MTLDDIKRLEDAALKASGDLGRAVAVLPGQLAELCRLARQQLAEPSDE